MKILLDFVKKLSFLGAYPKWKSNHAKYLNSYDYELSPDYCPNTPFKFAFGLLILGWIILGPLILVFLYMILYTGLTIIQDFWGRLKNIRENRKYNKDGSLKYKKEAETIDLEKKIEGSKESFGFLNLKKNEEQEEEEQQQQQEHEQEQV